jgi:uncharacterized protein (TIGR02145 family)
VNTTIITETPTVSKIFDVEFVNCIDKDNKSYKVVKIGKQWWMEENMAYLPAVDPPSSESCTEPRYYVYDYYDSDVAVAKQQANYTTYGVLYNWSAAKSACPWGWHLPTDAECTELERYLIANGYNYDGSTTGNKIAKSMAATTNWNASSYIGTIGNNLSLNNKSGFSLLPGGRRFSFWGRDGTFDSIGNYVMWWISIENPPFGAENWYTNSGLSAIMSGGDSKVNGFSVRYVKD